MVTLLRLAWLGLCIIRQIISHIWSLGIVTKISGRWVELNQELSHLVRERLDGYKLDGRNPWQAALAALTAKAWRTHKGLVLLAQAGLGQDATILSRSLFNILVIVKWLAQEPEQRVKQYSDYDWVLRGKADKAFEGYERTRGRDPHLSAEELHALQSTIEEQVARVEEEHQFGTKGWSKKTILRWRKLSGLRRPIT